MNVVIDTNILISGIFFGGYPGKIIEAVVKNKFDLYADKDIIEEYIATVDEICNRYDKHLDKSFLVTFLNKVNVIDTKTDIHICRDEDDNKFVACAIDAGAAAIVSGDEDLRVLKEYGGIKILSAKGFCEEWLN